MHRILVQERRWLSEREFLQALSFCFLLPGPEAQQLCTYAGWRLRGVCAGLLAGGLFILPGFFSILVLSYIYVIWREVGFVAALFFGIQTALLGIVAQAMLRLARRTIHSLWQVVVAAIAMMLMVAEIPFPAIVFLAGLVGWIMGRTGKAPAVMPSTEPLAGSVRQKTLSALPLRFWRPLLTTGIGWLVLWWLPVVLLGLTLGGNSFWVQLGTFFGQLAAASFGGAYAVLAWLTHAAVDDFQWVTATEMQAGLGLAETTPGPLIQVVQFVGFLAAWKEEAGLPPWLAGLGASVLVTWMTFAPSFLWIFALSPAMERLLKSQPLQAALQGVFAATVGAMVFLATWFGVRILFLELNRVALFGKPLAVPLLASFDPVAASLAVVAAVALFRGGWSVPRTLALNAALSLLIHRWWV